MITRKTTYSFQLPVTSNSREMLYSFQPRTEGWYLVANTLARMETVYSFSSPNGDVIVEDDTLARPFMVRPFQNHPFMTLRDYFLAITDLVLREDGQSLTTLLSHIWKRPVEIAEVATVAIRYEKYGTLYHISSVEIAAEKQRVRLTVSAALTDESKEALDREFRLLQRLGSEKSLSYLPQAYCKHPVQVRKAEASETFLMALSEWFDNYHEWHFSTDEAGQQRIIVWDMKSGYRLMSEQETSEIIRQAASILTFYYDKETYHRIFPWHHGGGDFVVRATEGAIDVKLVTARGYKPIALPQKDGEIGTLRAIILFFLETTVKMRLDKYEGMGETTWADASVVAAGVDGFFRGLALKESEGHTVAVKVTDVMTQLKSFTEDDLKRLLHAHMNQAAARDTSDYTAISSHIDEHARDLYQTIRDR